MKLELQSWAESLNDYLRKSSNGEIQLFDFGVGQAIMPNIGQDEFGQFAYLTSHIICPFKRCEIADEFDTIQIEIYSTSEIPRSEELAAKIVEKFPTLAKRCKGGERFPEKVLLAKVME